MKYKVYLILTVPIFFLVTCFSKGEENEQGAYPVELGEITEKTLPEETARPEPLIIRYRNDTLLNKKEHFDNVYAEQEKEIILAINRISESRIRPGKLLAVPDTFLVDLLGYSPFPDIFPGRPQLEKLIIISLRVQAFALYENDTLIRWGPVSTGKRSTPTPSGRYHTNFKAKLKISTINSSWIMPWYYNIESMAGIALHEYILPGYPASHACIRLFKKDAVFIYNWAEGWTLNNRTKRIVKNGTPVIIYGEYDYKSKPPWHKLVDNSREMTLTEDERVELQKHLGELNRPN